MKIFIRFFCLISVSLASFVSQAQTQSEKFALGVEYLVPGLAEVYAKTGVVWAKAMGSGFSWGDIEPNPPVGGKHNYNWNYTDRLILEYQKAGFRHFQLYIRCMNQWASGKPYKLTERGSYPPKPEYLKDYTEFLRAIVQRYNIKSPDHCPGLITSVEHFEIEAEWGTGFWRGTISEYLDLLKVAYPTIKSANPDAKVILIGFFLAGLFEGNPDPAAIPSTLAKMPAQRRKITEQYLADIKTLLSHPELFDIVEFHSLSDWSEISGMTRFLRQTMRERGYEKPIWVGDVNYTASPLMFWGMPLPPYTEEQKTAIQSTLSALANQKNPHHKEAMDWFRAEQSKCLIKKVVLAMAEGASGINIGNLEDWKIFSFAPTIAGTAAFQGLIETKGIPPKPAELRPAYHALALVSKKLNAFSSVKPLQLGKGIFAYQFDVTSRPVYMLWYDDGKRYLPADVESSITAKIPLPQRSYILTETPVVAGGNIVSRKVIPANGTLEIKLTSSPIFIEQTE
jgi:hypothetical protein